MNYSKKVNRRYFRQNLKNPDGAIVHHGDCHFFEIGICDCRLLHDLGWMSYPEKVYLDYEVDRGAKG